MLSPLNCLFFSIACYSVIVNIEGSFWSCWRKKKRCTLACYDGLTPTIRSRETFFFFTFNFFFFYSCLVLIIEVFENVKDNILCLAVPDGLPTEGVGVVPDAILPLSMYEGLCLVIIRDSIGSDSGDNSTSRMKGGVAWNTLLGIVIHAC